MTIKRLIEILQTMPQDATIIADDGTGWKLAHVTEEGVVKIEVIKDKLIWLRIIGDGDFV